MDQESLISVIVPIYKVEKYLKRCVDSILNQTYKNLEIILVDDGSPDNCPKMCDEYAEKDDRIKVIHKENGGVSSARNAALKAASGDYIGFVDADDFIHPKMYEILLKNATENNCDCAICDRSKLNNDECVNLAIDEKIAPEILSTYDILKREFAWGDFNICCTVWNKLIKKNILGNIVFDETISSGEDTYFVSQIVLKCKRISYMKLPLYNYIQVEGSATNGALSDKYKIYSYYTVWKRIAYDLKDSDYEYLFGVAFDCFFNRLIIQRRHKEYDVKNRRLVKKLIRKEIPALLVCKGISIKRKLAYMRYAL